MGQSGDEYNKSGMVLFIFCMVFSFVFFIYIGFINEGVDLKELPEAAPGGDQIQASAPKAVDVSGVTNPWVSSDDMINHGIQVYKTNCAICHGPQGLGDGAAGQGLVPKPRNFVEGGWKKGGKSDQLFTSISKGLEGSSMAAFGHLPKVDRWALTHYIRSITKDKPEDDAGALEKFASTAK